ncbi:hypothetical protein [Sphingomonas sp.]|uniref:hypothetical protein n=1 Tax=Sphingomonas sp. TaxID=28214 RepID=UPI00307E0880
MFKLETDPTFTHTVTAMVPIDGGYEKQSFKVTYGVIDYEEFEKLDLNTRADSDTFLKRIVRRLDDIAGADGEPLPYSDQVRDGVLKRSWARSAIVRGYFEAIGKAATGN